MYEAAKHYLHYKAKMSHSFQILHTSRKPSSSNTIKQLPWPNLASTNSDFPRKNFNKTTELDGGLCYRALALTEDSESLLIYRNVRENFQREKGVCLKAVLN